MTATWQPTALEPALAAAIARHDVPGASLALHVDGVTHTAAAGTLNLRTGVAATTDSLFQIGSISKAYTATLALRLVERGLVSLETPIVEVVPRFRVADRAVTAAVTLRHLLTHTSGLCGDVLLDTGRGDDAIARAVAGYACLGQDLPFDSVMSYSNSAFVVLGHVIEALAGTTWDEALRQLLLSPLGLARTFTLPEDALPHRVALGHVGERHTPAPVWGLPRSLGPAGAICATASDLVGFARLHLDDGRTPDGDAPLRPATVAAMRAPRVRLDGLSTLGADAWGLGWMLYDWDGRRVFGHDGATIGQYGFLRIVPEHGVALALLTNGGLATDCFRELARDLLARTCGLAVPPPPAPLAGAAIDPAIAGTYEAAGSRLVVEARDGRLTAVFEELDELFDADAEPRPFELLPLDPERGRYVARAPHVLEQGTGWCVVGFPTVAGTRYAHVTGRAHRRVG